jgi:hypothetical protein
MIAVNPIIECFSWDLVTEYWKGLESSAVHTAPPFFVETLMVNQIGVYLACHCICMHRQLILLS